MVSFLYILADVAKLIDPAANLYQQRNTVPHSYQRFESSSSAAIADPLSISASIAGLVSLADIVFLRLTKYIKSVKNAESEINDLCKEVNVLGGAVSMLSRLARGHEMEDEPFNKDFRMYHIEGCAFILNEICEKTKKYDTTPKGKLLRLMWPYTSSKTKELLANLSRHKENINLALTANSMEALLRCLAKDEDRAKAIAEIQADVQKTREIVARIQEDSHQKEVLRFFLPYNPQPNYEMSVKLRHPMTGMWLERLPSFQTWLSSPSSRLWLSGIPGAGKTVLAGSIIGQALLRCSDTVAVGFFFCDYKNELTQTPVSVLGALAHQIARQNEQAYLMLEEYYSELHPERGLPRSPDPDDLARVIVTMAKAFDQVYLVIDGLDECQDSTDEVVRALCDIGENSDEISLALLSRHEGNIRDSLQGPETHFINIQIAAHKEDITEYVTSEIQERIRNKRLHLEDLSLQGEILDGLVDGANGMFRWVACQLDHLGSCVSDEQCRQALRSLPPDLPETYLRILKRIPKAQQLHVQLTLDFIAYADFKLSIAQLREVLSVPANSSLLKASAVIREDAITRICSSLVRKSNDGNYLEFAHFSVKEFLMSEFLELSEFQMFSISKGRSHRVLATRCIEFLQLDNFNHLPTPTADGISTMKQTNLQHPFYSYAAQNWDWNWNEELESPDIIEMIHQIINESFRPLHFAATLSLPEITSALLMQIDRQDAEKLFEGMFKCAVNVLNGALQECCLRSGLSVEIPQIFQRHVGTVAWATQYTLETLEILIEYFEKVPENIIGFSMRCWARSGDFSVAQLLEMQNAVNDGKYYWLDEEADSLLGFCKYLSSMIDESPLHFELCRLVWEFVIKVNDDLDYLNSWEVDSRISKDLPTLRNFVISGCEQITRAEAFAIAVRDPRLDVSSITDSDTRNGPLHMLVLADHDRWMDRWELREEEWADEINEMLNVLLDGGCNLSSRNNEGHTPLSLALQKRESRVAQIILKRPEFAFGAWESPIPILRLVAQLGSQDVLDQLLRLGFCPSPADYGNKTPLHFLDADTELALVIRLEELFPGARKLRADEKMPWELYLDATNFNPRSVDVLEFLVQPLLCNSELVEGAKVWEYYTSNLLPNDNMTYSETRDRVITSLVKSGALRHYEKVHLQTCLLPVVSALSAFSGDLWGFPIADSTICLLIENTDYWATFRETPSAVQMLKLSATFNLNMAVSQLLERGVGVHRRHDGESALKHVYELPAIDDNSISRVQQFLKHADSTSINQTNPTSGLGLIHISNDLDEQQCRGKILELTVESGASPDLRTASDLGFTGLLHHLHQSNFDSACILLDQGANPLLPSLRGWTAVHMAAAKDATPFLSRLLSPKEFAWMIDWESGCRSVFCSEKFDNATALHLAAAGSGEFLLLLLERVPAINVEATTGNGLTAIHSAAMAGSINCTDILVSRGANVNARSADGRLALHIAVEKGNLGLVERLLELGSEMTARSDGMTPQLLAYGYNHRSVIDRLKAHAAESPAAARLWDNVPSSALAKAVSGAVRSGSLSACKILLGQQSFIDVDISEDGIRGFTPLGFAIRHGMLEISKWLLEEGANANCQNADGTSAVLDMINDHSLNPILPAMLDKYFADGGNILGEPNSLIYSAVDAGNTEGLSVLLRHIRANGNIYKVRAGAERLTAVQIAVNRGRKQFTPLHRAIQCEYKEATHVLVDNGADLEAMDSFNRTPLNFATQKLSNEVASSIVPLLVQAGSNLNCRDDEGMDPLMGACESRSPDAICYLLDQGVSLLSTDHIGQHSTVNVPQAHANACRPLSSQ
ncbi:ankyrin repeat protein [Colletotrichum asianum]|uniref:Ankyrin repeat protein n=1 Tax=Colletotrichum asianum TaxID=702518 RepID=A0A8H3W0D0_9PEZI|nr:ankyrin repeat protein [Colletotrichum asianum]